MNNLSVNKRTFVILMVIALLPACSRVVDVEQEKQAVLALLEQERLAHIENNASMFVSGFMDSIITVNRGRITYSSRPENIARFDTYFNSVNFVKWDDVREPEIKISDDGTMAYAVVQKEVILEYKETATPQYDTTHFAWVSVYRKQADGWKLECNISTNR